MRHASKKVYQTDLTIQKILLIPMMILYCTLILGFLGLMLQFFVGIVQVTSGLIHALYYKDIRRQKYLLGVIAYFAIWALGGLLIPHRMVGIEVLGFLWMILVPVGIALWYYNLTKKDLENAEEHSTENKTLDWQEDILDIHFE